MLPTESDAGQESSWNRRRSSINRICRILTGIFLALYLAALALLAIGTFGLFGQARDPLSGVFLVPLGLPWNLMLDPLPEALWPWLAAAAPALNLLALYLVCRAVSARQP